MSRIAIVAALEREVSPLINTWRVCEREHEGRRFRFFESGEVVVICGGIGAAAARRAAEAVIANYHPAIIYSAGFAGALDASLKVGDVISPRRIVDSGDSSSVVLDAGEGVLVSFRSVATPAQKAMLRESYGAQAVDMEAAAVARAADARGVPFAAVKVISDEMDFELPATEQFVTAEGKFLTGRFALHAALRPWLWGRVVHLARNSKHASRKLCDALRRVDVTSTPRPVEQEGVQR
jgi:adenosylhomocysteine nucleosidase